MITLFLQPHNEPWAVYNRMYRQLTLNHYDTEILYVQYARVIIQQIIGSQTGPLIEVGAITKSIVYFPKFQIFRIYNFDEGYQVSDLP